MTISKDAAPVLTIDHEGIFLDEVAVAMRPRAREVFARIAEGKGAPVAKKVFIAAGLAQDVNGLKVHVSAIRKAFRDQTGIDPVWSTAPKAGIKKADRFDGYALNIDVLRYS